MQAVKINNEVCIYADNNVPEKFSDKVVQIDTIPDKPLDGKYHLDMIDNQLVWEPDPAPAPPTLEERVDTLESDVDAITTAVERGLSL